MHLKLQKKLFEQSRDLGKIFVLLQDDSKEPEAKRLFGVRVSPSGEVLFSDPKSQSLGAPPAGAPWVLPEHPDFWEITQEEVNQFGGDPLVWVPVGTIGVDSGLCWLGDPGYILHREEGLPKPLGRSWDDFCSSISEVDHKDFGHELGHEGLGVVVNTGYGDGFYGVEARFTEEGRIAEVRVVFIDDLSPDPSLALTPESLDDPDLTEIVSSIQERGFVVEEAEIHPEFGISLKIPCSPLLLAEEARRLQTYLNEVSENLSVRGEFSPKSSKSYLLVSEDIL
jgi:hypothetical protein